MNEIFEKSVKIIDTMSKEEYNKLTNTKKSDGEDATEEGYVIYFVEDKEDKNFYWIPLKSVNVEVGVSHPVNIPSNAKLLTYMKEPNIILINEKQPRLDGIRSIKRNVKRKRR